MIDWKKPEEEMPERIGVGSGYESNYSCNVLLTTEDTDYDDAKLRYEVLLGYYQSIPGIWRSREVGGDGVIEDETISVIAWAKLPEPFRKESEKT